MGIQNPAPNKAEYHIKGNEHTRAVKGIRTMTKTMRSVNTQGRTEATRDDKPREALPEDLGPVPSGLKESKRGKSKSQ